MKYYCKILYLLLFSFFLTNGLLSQEMGNINGIVYNKVTKEGIPDVQVFIKTLGMVAISTEDGLFELKDIPEGVYVVETKAIGFVGQKNESIKVLAGQSTKIEFILETDDLVVDEITVSATKTAKSIKSIGSPVHILGQRELEQTEGRNIDEALLTVPGVFSEDRHHGEAAVVSFRGVGLHTHVTRGILVLVDGVPITEAMGRTTFEGIDMYNAEKVEVLKGPVSALYGPNGITGVINVISKKPKDGIHGGIDASYGSYNTSRIAANINGGANGFNYLIKGSYYNSVGYQDRSDYSSARGGLKFSKDFKKYGKLAFSAEYNSNSDLSGGPLDSAQFVERSTEATLNFTGSDKKLYRLNLDYVKTWDNSSALVVNTYIRGRFDEGHYMDTRWGKDDVKLFGGEARYRTVFTLAGKKNTLTFGGRIDREDAYMEVYLRDGETGAIGDLDDQGESIYDMIGFYMEDDFYLSDKLVVTLGLRYDIINYNWKDQFNTVTDNTSDNTSIAALSPKFGFAYNPVNQLTVFGNVGRGFNPPQISQLFIGSSYSGLANPDLKPEYLTNYEIGVRGSFIQKLDYQVSCFLMDFIDQISSEIDPTVSTTVPVNKNIGDTRHQGVEASINYQVLEGLNTYVSYSYLDARFVENPENELINNVLRKTPHNQFGAGVRYGFKFGLTASINYKLLGEYYMDNEMLNLYDGHSIVNAKIMYKKKGFKASFSVNNLLDKNYATWAYASQSYNPVTHQSSWGQSYYAGWPRNFTFTLGYSF
jgi:iron complex outermembrane recepter protein